MPGKLVSMDDFREWILSTITRLAVVAATIRRPTMGCLLICDYSTRFIRRYLSMPNVLLLIALELMLLLIGLFSSHFSPLGFHCMIIKECLCEDCSVGETNKGREWT